MAEMRSDPGPDVAGDEFLDYFLPGDSKAAKELRATIYRINLFHKKSRVPSLLLLGPRGVGKSYVARVVGAHYAFIRKGVNFDPTKDPDIRLLAGAAGFRSQTLTAIPETLIEAELFGVEKGAFTGAQERLSMHMSTSAGVGRPCVVFLLPAGKCTTLVNS